MSRFKVGDFIIGNEENDYNVTNKYNVCGIVEVLGEGFFMVKIVIATLEHSNAIGNMWAVEGDQFKFYGVPDNTLSRFLYPEWKEYNGRLVPEIYE